ncbi:MAG: SDR family oxidoreductase [Flavobacteriales bacterium]|nr:SDR family oxidoreductase [Flavobacteriales bacterium]MCX7769061.1 SDR family oxidoreductase [Flavobacteriales bacterium]MDW8410336.1 SDR family oxidoreductase [Flavobacteriales bacterium]
MQKHPSPYPSVLILGALSDVALAMAELYASRGYRLLLAARQSERLERIVSDLRLRFNAEVKALEFDARQYDSHQEFVDSLPELPDVAIVAFGYLGDQEKALHHFPEALRIIESNYTGAVSILNRLYLRMAERGHGTLAAIASVAGLRGRMSNFHYGSAKAGLIAYLSGLRNLAYHHGVHVITLIPGFMRTRMIAHMKTPGFLTLSPSKAAHLMTRAIQKRRNVAYIGPLWWLIMCIIRTIPESIFKKLKL